MATQPACPPLFLSFLILSLAPVSPIAAIEPVYLFYSTQGQGQIKAGLYGGQVQGLTQNGELRHLDNATAGQLANARQFGYNCVQYDESADTSDDLTHLRAVSFDEITGRALLFSDMERLSLASVPACRPFNPQCANTPRDGVQVLFYKVPPSSAVKPGPFAAHDSRLYFLLERSERVRNAEGKRVTLELRRVAPRCSNMFPVSTSFEWVPCSDLLAVVSEVVGREVAYRPMDNLLVVPVTGGGGSLDVYLVLQRLVSTNQDADLSATAVLYHVRVPSTPPSAQQPIRAKVCHEHPIRGELVRYLLYHQGALSAREGHVCWSAVETVFCGSVGAGGGVGEGEGGGGVQRCLQQEDVKLVCKGADTLNSVVTGVALASTLHHQYLFYFGCVSQTGGGGGASIGGAGLARVNQRDGSRVFVTPLRYQGTDVSPNDAIKSRNVTASSLFLTTCSEKFSMAVATGNVIGGQVSGGVACVGQWLFVLSLFAICESVKFYF